MSNILVTGASGHVGRMTLEHLLKRLPSGNLVGLARDPEKAADLAEKGIGIRVGDYSDKRSLRQAFEGVEKVMLISAPAFTDRKTEHANVIHAAREAGVKHVVYMPIIRKEGSTFQLQQVTEPDIFTENELISSGLTYTIMRHPPFLESIPFFIGGNAYQSGVRIPTGSGRVAAASRDNLAEAHAVVLTEAGHENKSYSLAGSPAVSFAAVARIIADVSGAGVPYVRYPSRNTFANAVAAGLPQVAAEFALGWVRGINIGEWDEETGDLED